MIFAKIFRLVHNPNPEEKSIIIILMMKLNPISTSLFYLKYPRGLVGGFHHPPITFDK